MKALVTGANGFTGSHLVKIIQQRGDSVVGLVRKSSKLNCLAVRSFELIYGDISNRDALRRAMSGVDTVFHTAAYVELRLVNATKMAWINVEGTRAVMEVPQELGVSKVVYCSTVGIYGDIQGKVINETFKRTQADFSSAYDSTKYEAQQIVDRLIVSQVIFSDKRSVSIALAYISHFALRGCLKSLTGSKKALWCKLRIRNTQHL